MIIGSINILYIVLNIIWISVSLIYPYYQKSLKIQLKLTINYYFNRLLNKLNYIPTGANNNFYCVIIQTGMGT